jgi:hypothetical protein
MTFSGDIGKFNNKVEKAANAIFRGTALDLARRLIIRTPVDQGYARGGWGVRINGIPADVKNNADKTGQRTIESANAEISKAKIGDSIFIVNGVEYIGPLENGHSDQRPNGMLKVTVTEYQNIVKMQARKKR